MKSLQSMKQRLAGWKAERETYSGQDLRSGFLANSSFRDCTFLNCQLDLASFNSAVLENCDFLSCEGRLSNFVMVKFRGCRFEKCDLEQALFAGATLDGVVFQQCRLAYSTFEKASGVLLTFKECNLHGADLRFYRAPSVDYQGSNLWSASVQLGCTFFNGTFDQRSMRLFLGMLARLWQDGDEKTILSKIAGTELAVVERLMRDEDGEK